jgi:aspartyl aminopeptidase
MAEKTENEILKDKLFYTKKNALEVCDKKTISDGFDFCEGYKAFLNTARTEREAVTEIIRLAEKNGYTEYDCKSKYSAGDKVYYNNRGKSVILSVIGKLPVEQGVKIAAAHIDSPRLDLKPNPLYEDNGIALFKTHYYGGLRKYQWSAIPLALHGVVVKSNGEKVDVRIGDDENDPVFVITDLLPHLAQEQSKRTLAEGIKGEELNIVIGSRPVAGDKESELVKLNVLKILNEKYGMVEEDFLSAELEIVPAFKAVDVGLDRSMIGSYGHDDRVCAYPSMMAQFAVESPEYTTVTVLTDKEEIGSDGNTGLNSSYLKYFVHNLANMQGGNGEIALSNSKCLSADVNSCFDPTFSDVFERKNASFLNCGACVTKYTGARGKSGSSDASAEYVGYVRRLLNDAGVVWQTGELGKVDAGGGGTVAMYIANLGVDVVDLGVPVLSMHAPFELVSKMDVYMCYKAVKAFYEAKQ